MTIDNVTLGTIVDPEWGNAVADQVNTNTADIATIEGNNWVTTAKINDGAVTGAKIANTTWTSYESTEFRCVFMGGFVLCMGVVISSSSSTAEELITTGGAIAAEFRPAGNRYLPVTDANHVAGAINNAYLRIGADGHVHLLGTKVSGHSYLFSGVYDV